MTIDIRQYNRILRMHRKGFDNQIISRKLGVKLNVIEELLMKGEKEKEISKEAKLRNLIRQYENQVNILWLCLNRAIDDIDRGYFSIDEFYDSAVKALNDVWIK